ncbi:MAG: patatin-like phospholipase family protein, partial [Desulfatitalea sp.]|nr:patatin-like phospholipase family protein [Desulfatitalea sp.]
MKTLIVRLVWPVFFVFNIFSPSLADVTPQGTAIAISGGASVGAYEAGLNWAMIEIARLEETAERVALDVVVRPRQITSITGTSAGGINALLSAMTWAVRTEDEGGFPNRIDDNIFRDLWLTPDVNQLLPADANSALYLPDDALLARWDLMATADALRQKWRSPGVFRPDLRIPLGVTVTRVVPESIDLGDIEVQNQRFYIPFEMRTNPDGSAGFAFDPHDYPLLRAPDLILMPFVADKPFAVSD